MEKVTVSITGDMPEILHKLAIAHEVAYGVRPKGFALGPEEYLQLCSFVEDQTYKYRHPEAALIPVTVGYQDEFMGFKIEAKTDPGISIIVADKRDVLRFI